MLNAVKPLLSDHSKKRQKIGFQDDYRLMLNASSKYCRMLQGEQSAVLSTFINLPFVIKFFVLSMFEWSLKTGCTVFKAVQPRVQTMNLCIVFTFPALTNEGPSFRFTHQKSTILQTQRVHFLFYI